MSFDEKELDARLRSWPAVDRDKKLVVMDDDDSSADTRAEAIVRACRGATLDERLGALLQPPSLVPEPGEPSLQPSGAMMTDDPSRPADSALGSNTESASGSLSSKPDSLSTPIPSVSSRPRQSLRELAQRASQSGAPKSSSAPVSTPVPSTATPLPSAPRSTPLPRVSLPKAKEAASDDSGFVDLAAVQAAATPQQRAAADAAKPGEQDLFDDDAPKAAGKAAPAAPKSAPASKPATPPVPVTNAPPVAASNRNGMLVGVLIAAVGLAAAFTIWKRNQAQEASSQVVAEVKTAPPVLAQTAAPKPVETAPVAVAKPADTGTNVDALPDKTPELHGTLPGSGALPSATEKVATNDKVAPTPTAGSAPIAPPDSTGKPGDLVSEMEKRAGKGDGAKTDSATPEPAAGSKSNGSVPEVPSQGSVSAAVASVMAAAKSCVAGGDDVSRAQVTFGSNGNVTGVVVTGWAAANGKSSCVKSAFQGANVGGFSKPSYTFSATIRP